MKHQNIDQQNKHQSFKNKRRRPLSRITAAAGMLLFFLGAFAFAQEQPEQDAIEHEVSVRRALVPIFAYDKKGNPVEDLKSEEIQLFVNGKLMKLTDMNRIRFNSQEEVPVVNEKTGEITYEPKYLQRRMVFIVLDSMYNSFYGLRKAKKLARELVENDKLGTEFVIMESTLYGGLRLMGGPEADIDKLKKYIGKVSKTSPDEREDDYDVTIRNPAVRSTQNWNKLSDTSNRIHKKQQTKFYLDFLAQLKYSLQSITRPKLVVLLSEGFSETLFYEVNSEVNKSLNFDPEVLQRLNHLVEEINAGGSVVYTVFTGRLKAYRKRINNSTQGETEGEAAWEELGFTLDDMDLPISSLTDIASLQTISGGTGGKHFEGSTKEVVNKVQTMTSAYYELAFSPDKDAGKSMRIKVKSTRKDVRIDSMVRIFTREEYKDMEKIQKKVFALNLLLGRQWAHVMATIDRVRFTQPGQEEAHIRVDLPPSLQGRSLDIFMVSYDDNFQNPDVMLKKRKMTTDTVTINYKRYKNSKALYFLIVEPNSTRCLYNRII